jgi:tRNA modification GTPase
MVYHSTDRKGLKQKTIAAISTARGKAGIGILRVSGQNLQQIFSKICLVDTLPKARQTSLQKFHDVNGSVIDQGFVIYFQAPFSFTGEEVLEFHCHGNPVILDLLLARILESGAQLAQPGEFSLRAFLNGKIDLVQAEAIADLIDAKTARAVNLAQESLQGVFSQKIQDLVRHLISLRVEFEAWLDFPDEELDLSALDQLLKRTGNLIKDLTVIIQTAHYGCLMQEGIVMVISGPPNVGKSSLLNQLAQKDAAIVTEIAGTTRDLLHEFIQIDGFPVQLIDTAGIHETSDLVEQEGIRRAKEVLKTADLVLILSDNSQNQEDSILDFVPGSIPRILVKNKVDLADQRYGKLPGDGHIGISAKFGQGIEDLKAEILSVIGISENEEALYIARRRHLEALELALSFLQNAMNLGSSMEKLDLIAEELFHAQQALNRITGVYTNEDLLGDIFSSFCIGK